MMISDHTTEFNGTFSEGTKLSAMVSIFFRSDLVQKYSEFKTQTVTNLNQLIQN